MAEDSDERIRHDMAPSLEARDLAEHTPSSIRIRTGRFRGLHLSFPPIVSLDESPSKTNLALPDGMAKTGTDETRQLSLGAALVAALLPVPFRALL